MDNKLLEEIKSKLINILPTESEIDTGFYGVKFYRRNNAENTQFLKITSFMLAGAAAGFNGADIMAKEHKYSMPLRVLRHFIIYSMLIIYIHIICLQSF